MVGRHATRRGKSGFRFAVIAAPTVNVKPTPLPMKNNTATSAQNPETLLNDLRTLVSEAEQMMGGAAGEHSEEAVGAMRARFEAAQERFADLYAGAKKKVVAGAKYTDTAIRANPY